MNLDEALFITLVIVGVTATILAAAALAADYIQNITFSKTASLHLRHPGTDAPMFCDDKTPMVIELVGEASDEYKAAARRWQNENMSRPGHKLTADQIEDQTLDMLVALTKGWRLQWDDGLLPFSPQYARELYASPGHEWIKSQVKDFFAYQRLIRRKRSQATYRKVPK